MPLPLAALFGIGGSIARILESRNRSNQLRDLLNQGAQRSEALRGFLEGRSQSELEEIFGGTPEAILFDPVDITQSQNDAIQGNIFNLPDIQELVFGSNAILDEDALERARRFIPGFESSTAALGGAAGELLEGRLPFDDVLSLVSDRQGLSNTLGIPGTSTNATLKDLGLSQLDAINQGTSLFSNLVNIAEQVNPVNRRLNPASQLLDPSFRVQQDINQRILRTNSLQNAANIAAAPNPVAANLFASQFLGGNTGGISPFFGLGGGGNFGSTLFTELPNIFSAGGQIINQR